MSSPVIGVHGGLAPQRYHDTSAVSGSGPVAVHTACSCVPAGTLPDGWICGAEVNVTGGVGASTAQVAVAALTVAASDVAVST